MLPTNLRIVPLIRLHAQALAELHIACIQTGFISSLGTPFVKALYEAIADNADCFCFVALLDGRVAGFICVTTDVRKLYRAILRRRGFRFCFLLCRKAFSVQSLKKILETLFYPQRTGSLQLPAAEFLSGAVSPDARVYALFPLFIQMGLEELKKRGIGEVKILAAESLQPINKMYRLMGFPLRTKVMNHGVVSNIYVVPTNFFSSRGKGLGQPSDI